MYGSFVETVQLEDNRPGFRDWSGTERSGFWISRISL